MKKILFIFFLFSYSILAFSQNVAINESGSSPNTNAILDINADISHNKGILIPRLTTTERSSMTLSLSESGLTVFDTDTKSYWYWDGSTWQNITKSGVSGSGTSTCIAFWTGAGTIGSNSNLYWDNVNNRLGIGTSNPNAALYVAIPNSGDDTRQELAHLEHAGQNNLQVDMFGGDKDLVQIGVWNDEQNISIVTDLRNSIEAGTSTKGIYIKSGGNIGFGTTTPETKLEIKSDDANRIHSPHIDDGVELVTAENGGIEWYLDHSANSYSGWVAKAVVDNVGSGWGDGFLHFYTAGTGATEISTMALKSGRVGIGTTSPEAKLDVVLPNSGGDTRQGIARFLQLNQNTLQIDMFGGSKDLVQIGVLNAEQNISIVTDSKANIEAGTSTKGIYIKAGGNVGIGTNNPGTKLQINNTEALNVNILTDVVSSTRYYYLGIFDSNDGEFLIRGILSGHTQAEGKATVNVKFSARDGLLEVGDIYGTVGTSSDILIYQDGSSFGSSGADYKIYLAVNSWALVELDLLASGFHSIVTFNNTYSEAVPTGTKVFDLKTDTGAIIRVDNDGNMALGIISPTQRLDINGQVRIRGGNPAVNRVLVSTDANGNAQWQDLSSFGGVTGVGSATRVALWTGTSTIGSNSNLYWDNNNNRLGIGTTSPQEKLSIAGISSSIELGAGVTKEISAGKIAYQKWSNGLDIVGAGTQVSNRQIKFWAEGGAFFTGNVGIGTSTPEARLDVVLPNSGGDTRQEIAHFLQSNQNTLQIDMFGGSKDLVQIGVLNAEQNISIVTDSEANIESGTSTKGIYIKSGGNVGIATHSPLTWLQIGNPYSGVASNWPSTLRYGLLVGNSTDNVYFGLDDKGSNANYGTIIFGDDGGDYFTFQFNNPDASRTELIRIKSNGYVGLGVTNPAFRIELPNTANAAGQGRANAWVTYSDSRIKYNQQPIDYGLNEIMRIQPKRYEQHSSVSKANNLDIQKDSENTIGIIAQELYDVIPEAVYKPENEENDLWSIDYDKLIPVLIKAIQEQQQLIQEQQQQIEKLNDKIDKMVEK